MAVEAEIQSLYLMQIVALIPARGGSKSIPRKNLKELGGKPLIAYSIESALKCGLRTIVSTDDEEIAKIAREYGAEVVKRSAELAQDETSMYEVLKSEVPKLEADTILLLQPTTPFRNGLAIGISYFKENPQYDSLIFASKVPEKYHPDQVIIQTAGGKKMATGLPIAKRKTRRQDFSEAWVPEGTYIFKASNLEKGSMYGDEVMILESEPNININNLDDWAKAEEQIQK